MDIPFVKNLMDTLKNCYSNSKLYQKRQWLSIVQKSGLTFSNLKKSGWKMSNNRKSWHTAQKHSSELYAGAPVPEKRGRNNLEVEIGESIITFLKSSDNTYPASNRSVYMGKDLSGEKIWTPVIYRNKSVACLYDFWVLKRKNEQKKICCQSKFRETLKKLKYIKKPKKSTDMCHICESGKKIIKKLSLLNENKNQSKNEEIEVKKLKVREELYKKHLFIADSQKKSFNDQIKKINSTTQAIIIIDFKQNVTINQDTYVELGRDWYKSPQRTVFGVVVYFFNSEENTINKCFFDFFSKYMNHNSHFVITALKNLFETKFFTSKKFTDLSFWMDNGPCHFKTKELFNYFSQLGNGVNTKVQWNFFGEYHGKNPCDTRFSQISYMLKQHVNNQNNKKIKSTKALVRSIRNEQNIFNERRINLINEITKKNENNEKKLIVPKSPKISYQILLNVEDEPKKRNVLVINKIKLFYSFKINQENKISSFIYTNDEICEISKKKVKEVRIKKKKNIVSPEIDEKKDDDKIWKGQQKKFKKIEKFLNSKKNIPKKRKRSDPPPTLTTQVTSEIEMPPESPKKKLVKGPSPNIPIRSYLNQLNIRKVIFDLFFYLIFFYFIFL
jgi:hypothetical protein